MVFNGIGVIQMNKSIRDLIRESQGGNEESLLEIITRFKPLILSYSKKTNYEDMENVLICHLIYIVKSMIPMKDGKSINYIKSAIKNKYINTLIKEKRYKNTHHFFCETLIQGQLDTQEMVFDEMMNYLDETKRFILIWKYRYGYSDQEIGQRLNISRQAVNKQKRQAFKVILRDYLNEKTA